MAKFYDAANMSFIDALQFKGNFEEVEKFVGGDAGFCSDELVIATSDGPLRAKDRDWIIKTSKGKFTTVEPREFINRFSPAYQG
ncbi:hypothetical protein D3C87_1130580 [compost metagenome]